MQFEIGSSIFTFGGGFGETIDFDAAAAKRVFELDAVAIGAGAISGNRMRASERGGAEETAAEARAFFIRPIDDANGDGRFAREFFDEAPEDFKGSDDVEGAVEPAAVRNAIEMAAEEERFFAGAGEGDPVVAGGVVVVFDGKGGEFLGEPFAGFKPSVGPGDALGPVFVGGERAEFFEFGDGALWV